ncbi:MAG: hypothetical protein WD404_08310, partial [Solirubrobacterales bacterium]
GTTIAALVAIEPTLADLGNRLAIVSAATTYTVNVASDRDDGAAVFSLNRSSDGTSMRTCSVAGGAPRAGCAAGGWSYLRNTIAIDAQAKSVAVTAAEAMETCATDNNGSYAAANCGLADLVAIEPTLTDAGVRLAVGSTATGYGIAVASDRDGFAPNPAVTNAAPPMFTAPTAGVQFRLVRDATGATTRTCVVATGGNGGCSITGTW